VAARSFSRRTMEDVSTRVKQKADIIARRESFRLDPAAESSD
jgi:hypothetical protein